MGSAITGHGTKCGSTMELSVQYNRQDNSHDDFQNWFPLSLWLQIFWSGMQLYWTETSLAMSAE